MKYVNEFGVAPTRGTNKSVGLDFYMPDPSKWTSREIDAFCAYLRDKNHEELAALIEEDPGNVELMDRVLLYISHQYRAKWTFEQWDATCYYGSEGVQVRPGESILVPTGIRTMFSPMTYGEFENKSGMGSKGWQVGAKVIDEDYTGYVHINLHNVSDHDNYVVPGQKLSQLIERPVVTYDAPEEIPADEYFAAMSGSTRGSGAFGHTGA